VNRGDVVDVDLPELGRRPAVIVTREVAIAFLADVTVASITSRMRGLPTEVRLDHAQGLDHDSVVNCHHLFTVPKTVVGPFAGSSIQRRCISSIPRSRSRSVSTGGPSRNKCVGLGAGSWMPGAARERRRAPARRASRVAPGAASR